MISGADERCVSTSKNKLFARKQINFSTAYLFFYLDFTSSSDREKKQNCLLIDCALLTKYMLLLFALKRLIPFKGAHLKYILYLILNIFNWLNCQGSWN